MTWRENALAKLVLKIPVCGGFCDHNHNPSNHCLARFSNEGTVPRPCVESPAVRRVSEHNCCCRALGRVGGESCHRSRSKIMFSAFVVSAIAWILQIAAAFSLTTNLTTTRLLSWGRISGEMGSLDLESYITPNLILNEIFVNNKLNYSSASTWEEKDFTICDAAVAEACTACSTVVSSAKPLVIVGIFTQIFQMATDLQRSTVYGDLNCQKGMGFFTGIYGVVSSLFSFKHFKDNCYDIIPSKITIPANRTGTTVDLVFQTTAHVGPAFVLLFIATVLKAYDVFCHLIVPTPKSRHGPPVDPSCTLKEYMMTTHTLGATEI